MALSPSSYLLSVGDNMPKGNVCEVAKLTAKSVSTIKTEIYRMECIIKGFWIAGFFGLLTCIYWVLEPDPLTIKDTGTNPEIYVCTDGVFEFERYIKNSKHLAVTVEPRLRDLRTEAVYMLEAKTYEGNVQDGNVIFRQKITSDYPKGMYSYEPYVTYKNNPMKIISKKAPTQIVAFGCNSEPSALKEIDDIVGDGSIDLDTKIYFLNDIMVNLR